MTITIINFGDSAVLSDPEDALCTAMRERGRGSLSRRLVIRGGKGAASLSVGSTTWKIRRITCLRSLRDLSYASCAVSRIRFLKYGGVFLGGLSEDETKRGISPMEAA